MSSKQWHGGKGDAPRVGNDEAYRSNWDRIFGGIDYTTVDNGQGTVETVVTTMDTMDKNEVGKQSNNLKKDSDTVEWGGQPYIILAKRA